MPPLRTIALGVLLRRIGLPALCLAASVGCVRDAARPEAVRAPRPRATGPRWIPFSGEDPGARGWVKVDDLLWVESAHAGAFRGGLLWDGAAYVPFADVDRRDAPPEGAYVLRTDHLVVSTNVPFARARALAATFERHVAAVLDAFGEPLDLRLPADPLRVVVARRRSEFEAVLREKVDRPVEWGAFYVPAEGTVYASEERRESGGLSVVADARHELTHAVLDVGRPSPARGRMFAGPHFWAWEGAAVWTERLLDPAGSAHGSERFDRFRRRHAAGDVTPLADLFALRQADFAGRHYDQVASLTSWLMEADGGRARAGFLALLARAMDGAAEAGDFERLVGMTPEVAQTRWLATLATAGR